MRILKCSTGAVVSIAMIASVITVCPIPSAADDMQMTTCPTFTGTTWVNPMPPSNSGNRYILTLNKHEMSCAQAESWAKKLLVQHIADKPMMPQYPPLKGGPPGYVCTGSPDNTGHAYRGQCLKTKGGPFAASFNWSNE
jgi:hypothetical protein